MDDSGWHDIRLGLSGATVRRSSDGQRYRKSASGVRARAELIAERDRLLWLAAIGFPAARVIDWSDASDGPEPAAALVTSAVAGVPISSVSRGGAREAARSLALTLRDLHTIPTLSCPFDRTLSVTLAEAQAAVAEGAVDTDDFDDERRGPPPLEVLGLLLAGARSASEDESADLVVCHGDACLPNVLVDPDTLRPTGIVDVGRLGVADRHQDLALGTRSLLDPDLNPSFGSGCAQAFLDTYLAAMGLGPTRMDPDRLAFYRLLDEFF